MTAKQRILVTGGVGYVGRETVGQLVEAGEDEVHVIDNLACGEHRLAKMDQSRFTLHRADIRDADAIRKVLGAVKPDTIIHLAAIHYIPTCEAEPGRAVGVNVQGTVNLLDAAPQGTRFVFASTAAVYAPSDDAHVEEQIGSGPVDIYGLTKQHGERFVRYYHENGKVRGVIVRLFNVVGSGETNPHLAPAIIEQISDGNNRLNLGNLFPHRDYIDVRDAAHGFRALAKAEAKGGGLIVSNLGTGRTHEVGDVVKLIAKASGLDVTIHQDQSRVRAVDRPMLKASTERLRSLTGWAPAITLAESMRAAWATRAEDRLR
jgi:UDP-glucose 4-epimerase